MLENTKINLNIQNRHYLKMYFDYNQMVIEAMDQKLAAHRHYSSRQLKPMDKDLKHKEDFRVRYTRTANNKGIGI